MENSGLVIITNKVASALNLQTIEKYVKNTYNIKANHVKSPRLPQSKSFLKIISVMINTSRMQYGNRLRV